jgi:hypothetical protein
VTYKRPQIYAPGDLAHATDEALAAILDWVAPTDAERFIARFGTTLVRLEQDNGQLITVRLDRSKVTHLLSRVIDWRPWREEKESKPVPPPREVADDILAYPQPPFQPLERIVEVPVMAADGTVHDVPGYDPATRCFLRPADGLEVPPIAVRPTAQAVREARELLSELERDFRSTATATARTASTSAPTPTACFCSRSCAP